jgi:hypothetical protein
MKENAAMGIQVNRIEKEFIFSNLMGQKIHVSVHGHRKELRCRLAAFTDDALTFAKAESSSVVFSRDEEIRAFFPFHSNYYTFDARVKEQTGDELVIANPKSICRDPRRKYERVKLKGITLRFHLSGDKVELDFPKTETFTMVENMELPASVDSRGIGELIAGFRQTVQAKVSDHRIVMYRGRQPESIEERITVKTGKALWIPATDEDLPLNDPGFSGSVIVKREAEDFFAETGTPPYLIRSELSNLLFTKARSGIVSELYCPILYHEYAVGYIQVVTRRPRTDRLDEDMLQYILQFSRVLSHSLEVNGYYRQARRVEVEHIAPVIDLSASGLLFMLAEPELEKKMELFHDLPVRLELGGRLLTAGTRIMRKFADGKNAYFAAQFLEVSEEDLNFIYDYLYGKPFDEAAQAVWEGGSPPPSLASGAPGE